MSYAALQIYLGRGAAYNLCPDSYLGGIYGVSSN